MNCVCCCWWTTYLGSLSRAEQREPLWGAAEAWRSEHRSGDRHLSSFLCFTSSRCPRTQPNATCRLLRVYVCLGVRMSMRVCMSVQGPGMQRWLNPWLSEKHARLPAPMTLNTHMAVLGKTNGRKMEYTSTAGTGKEEEGRQPTHPEEQAAKLFHWVTGKDDFYRFSSVCLLSCVCCAPVRRYLPSISELL